jgi:WS/DGAT/MGAT family acyltransferase
MTEMYDLDPEGRHIEPVEIEPEHVPSDQELLTYAALSKLRLAADTVGLLRRTAGSITGLVRSIRDPGSSHGAVPLTAPRTPWNHAIGPHRTVSFARIPLEEAKAVKDALGVTLNDVILAVCSGTLRRYLVAHDELPEGSLIATCPVSVRTDDEKGSNGNKVSAMFASLATDVEDPRARIDTIAASTAGAKSDHDLIGARTLTDWAEWAAPNTFGLAARLYGSMNESIRPIHNLVISNVPGPPFPLYLAGAELVAAYPMGPIMDGAGLNITVLSYRSHIDFGFMADRDLVPDIWEVAAAVEDAFDELKQLAALVDPRVTKTAAPVTATSKKARTGTGDRRAATGNGAGTGGRRKDDAGSDGTPGTAQRRKTTRARSTG